MNHTVAVASNGDTDPSVSGTCDSVPVEKVKQNWREREDHSLAERLQYGEFEEHYDKNRSERRLVSGDIKVSKEEQKLEDKYAAEYWEQVRLDREKEDAKIAMEFQRLFEQEERAKWMQKVKEYEAKDEEIAKEIQRQEEQRLAEDRLKSSKIAEFDSFLASKIEKFDVNGIQRTSSGRIQLPSGLTPETLEAIRKAEGEPIQLPSGMTPEQALAIQRTLKEEDERVAQEIQDAELARYLQQQEENCNKTLPHTVSTGRSEHIKPPRPAPPQTTKETKSGSRTASASGESSHSQSDTTDADLISFQTSPTNFPQRQPVAGVKVLPTGVGRQQFNRGNSN